MKKPLTLTQRVNQMEKTLSRKIAGIDWVAGEESKRMDAVLERLMLLEEKVAHIGGTVFMADAMPVRRQARQRDRS